MHSENNRLIGLVFVLLALGFFALMYALLTIRFGGGDVYPTYSSLRADPKGTKALFESLAGLDGIQAQQNFGRWQRLQGSPKTIFFLGVDPDTLDDDIALVDRLGRLAEEGNRVVLGLNPIVDWSNPTSPSLFDRQPAQDSSTDDEEPQPEAEVDPNLQEKHLERSEADVFQLGFQWDILELNNSEVPGTDAYLALLAAAELPLPEQLYWRSTAYFTKMDPAWKVIYRHLEKPVLLERAIGAGSLVVLGDCYELSNQALWQEPEPGYLAWLVGSQNQVVFNETHLGLSAQTNLMGLIRRFRLHGVLFGLLVLAVLFVWRQSSSLVPPRESEASAAPIGQHAAAGLIHLLARGVPRSRLIQTCVAEWQETLKVHEPHLLSRETQVVSLMDAEVGANQTREQVVGQYNQIQKVLSTRSSSR